MTRNYDSFAAEWFRSWRAIDIGSPRDHRLAAMRRKRNAADRLIDIVLEDPEEAWRITVALIERAPSDEELGWIAAGPLEDLIQGHARVFADRIVREAEANPRFRDTLNYVWGWNVIPDEVWAELAPLLDLEVRAHWDAMKRAAARGRAASDIEHGKFRSKERWRPPSPRPKSQRIT